MRLYKPRSAFNPASCVSYIKSRRPDLVEPWGTPKQYAKTHGLLDIPYTGAVVITTEGPVGHVAYVEAVASDSLLISEANFLGDYVSTRSLPLDSKVIRGFR